MQTDYIHLYTEKMMKHLTSGIKRSESAPETHFHVLEKKITSGSTVLVLAVLVLRFIMTVEKNTAAVSQAVQ